MFCGSISVKSLMSKKYFTEHFKFLFLGVNHVGVFFTNEGQREKSPDLYNRMQI